MIFVEIEVRTNMSDPEISQKPEFELEKYHLKMLNTIKDYGTPLPEDIAKEFPGDEVMSNV